MFIANIIRRMITGDRNSIRDPKLIRLTRELAKQHQQFQPDNILTLLQLRFPFFVRLFEKLGLEVGGIITLSYSEFPIPLFVGFCHVLFWEFSGPAWAVASCSSGPQAGGTH